MKKSSSLQSHAQQWTEYLKCISCDKAFNHTDRCPVSLTCGHNVCKSCIAKNRHTICPSNNANDMSCDLSLLPINSALLQLIPEETCKNKEGPVSSPSVMHQALEGCPTNFGQHLKYYEDAKKNIENLALYLKPSNSHDLSRPMQRKLLVLVSCQLVEEEGRKKAIRACRALAERTATELILLHQNPSSLSANLWTAVRGRGCQFLGPAMQEEALKLIHLALEDCSELSRKVLVQLVVKNLQKQFTQASKTSIGHVVQLLYRASCFKVTKRDGDSSLMRLKDEFLRYDDLRKEHDTQIVQIAREAGLRIAPDQWSALLYGDQVHKSYMQSIIDKLQSGVTFQQCIQDLSLAVQSSGDPGNIQGLTPMFEYLSKIDSENPATDWVTLGECIHSVFVVTHRLVEFSKKHHHSLWQNQDANQQSSKYKTSLCRDFKNKGICPRGDTCTFAHSDHELQFHRNRRKKGGQNIYRTTFSSESSRNTPEMTSQESDDFNFHHSKHGDGQLTHHHICNCSNAPTQDYSHAAATTHVSYSHMQHHPHDIPQATFSSNLPRPKNIPPPQAQPPSVYQKQGQVQVLNYPQAAPSHPQQQPLPVAAPQPQMIAVAQSQTNQMYQPVNPMMPGTVAMISNEVHPPPPPQHYPHEQAATYYPPSYLPGTVHIMHDPVSSNMNRNIVQQQYNTQTHQASFMQGSGQHIVAAPGQNQFVGSPYYPVQPVHQQMAPPTEVIAQQPVIIPQGSIPVNASEIIPNVQSPTGKVVVNNSPSEIYLEAQTAQSEYVNSASKQTDAAVPPGLSHMKYPVGQLQPANQAMSLEELRQRKLEVINKLVQKRIVTPTTSATQQYKSYPSHSQQQSMNSETHISRDSAVKTSRVCVATYSNSPNSISPTGIPSFVSNQNTSGSSPTGSYSLWTGTTCIPSINSLSKSIFMDQNTKDCLGIDVLSDLDTTTSQVPSKERYGSGIYTINQNSFSSEMDDFFSNFVSTEDDFYPIQDQRIVSKFGPIARTVKSRTTPAVPEQVTANANSFTQPFASDKSRLKSKFVVNPESQHQMAGVCTEVEPTVKEKPTSLPSSYKLSEGLVATRTNSQVPLPNPAALNQALPMGRHTEMQEEAEDLLLAIELQQIEMGIQQKLISEKTNRSANQL